MIQHFIDTLPIPEADYPDPNAFTPIHIGATVVAEALDQAGEEILQQIIETPKERALGRIEHLKRVASGEKEAFRLYFVIGIPEHDTMHACFLEELDLPACGVQELSANSERHVAGVIDGLPLIRYSNLYENGAAYDVYYEAGRPQSDSE